MYCIVLYCIVRLLQPEHKRFALLLLSTALCARAKTTLRHTYGADMYCDFHDRCFWFSYTAISIKVVIVNSRYWNRKGLWVQPLMSDNAPAKTVTVSKVDTNSNKLICAA